MATEIPQSLIQICETHQDRSFTVTKSIQSRAPSSADTQDQLPKWNLTTHSIQPHHPLSAWLWLKDPIFRVSPEPLRKRMILDATTEWQERSAMLDFPRILSKKKAMEGFAAIKPDLHQAKAAMIAMERYSQDSPLLWILWNDKDKKVSFLDDKAFPREGGYKQIWILREPTWDRLWDASEWTSRNLVDWIQSQEKYEFNVEWPQEPKTATVKDMVAEYTRMNHNAEGLSKEELRIRLGRAKAIRVLSS
jgi:hypothetical protein